MDQKVEDLLASVDSFPAGHIPNMSEKEPSHKAPAPLGLEALRTDGASLSPQTAEMLVVMLGADYYNSYGGHQMVSVGVAMLTLNTVILTGYIFSRYLSRRALRSTDVLLFLSFIFCVGLIAQAFRASLVLRALTSANNS